MRTAAIRFDARRATVPAARPKAERTKRRLAAARGRITRLRARLAVAEGLLERAKPVLGQWSRLHLLSVAIGRCEHLADAGLVDAEVEEARAIVERADRVRAEIDRDLGR